MCSALTARSLSIDRRLENNKFHAPSTAATFLLLSYMNGSIPSCYAFVKDDTGVYSEVIKRFKGFSKVVDMNSE